ncbi:MAG: VWA domain-containing protein [Candidatus Acidiferrales bacterium]
MSINIRGIVKTTTFAAAVLSTAVVTSAQTQSQPQEKVGISVRSELVRVPVVVTNRHGAHVLNLNQNDFTVLENGQRRKIAFFHHIQPGAPSIEQTPSRTNAVTSNLERNPDHSAILVLDFLNNSVSEQMTGRKELMKFFTSSVSFVEPVCLVAFDSYGVRLVHDFTTNPALLAEALANVKGQRSPKDVPETNPLDSMFLGVHGWHSKSERTTQAALNGRRHFLQFSMAKRSADIRQRSWLTLEALREIGEAFSGIAGRKSLIWATGGGFPFQIEGGAQFSSSERGLLPAYENTWRALIRANISVYPLDVEDLLNPAYVSASVGRPLPQHFEAHSNVSNLESFAESTGGRLCDRQTTADGCLAAAADDLSDYYLLGFYETSAGSKPGWRKLAVKVDRPDMRVRTRSGYFVSGPRDPILTRKEDMELALTSPLDFTALPLTVRLTTITEAEGKKWAGFIFILPPGATTLDESENNHVSLDFAAVARTPDGSPAGGFSQNLEGHLKPDEIAALKSQGAVSPGSIDLPAGEYTIRFVVRDNISEQVGSTTATLKVP